MSTTANTTAATKATAATAKAIDASTKAKAAPRKSFILAAPLTKATHAIAKATAAAKATDGTVSNRLTVAAATVASATTKATALVAADAAATAYTAATAANASASVVAAAHELHMCALSLVGVFAYMDATLAAWVESRTDVTAAKYVRTKGKRPTLELVVDTTTHGTVHMSVNTTAALDYRKIDSNLDKRKANIDKRKATKGTAAKAKAAAKAAAK